MTTPDYVTACSYEPGGGAGAGSSGTLPHGTAAPDGFVIVGLTVQALNVLRVWLRGIGDVGSPFDPGSILAARSWALEPLDPDARVRLVQTVRLVSPAPDPVIDIFTDGPLSDDRHYRLAYVGATGAVTGCDYVDFVASAPDVFSNVRDQVAARDGFYDVANPQLPRDQVALGAVALGTFVLTSDGDLALDSGLLGLRKRVVRRLTAGVGDFFHMLDYGLDAESKSLLTPDRAARIAARARAQVLREPDVAQASVSVSSLGAAPDVLSLRVAVRPRSGGEIGIDVALRAPRAPR